MITVSAWAPAARWRRIGSSTPTARTSSKHAADVGPIPHSTPPSDSDTRSLPSVTLARRQPVVLGPDALVAGHHARRSRNVSLKWLPPVISTMGRTSMPGLRMSTTK